MPDSQKSEAKTEKSGTMYAQTVIKAGEDIIQPGDTVSSSTEGFDQMVESGSVGPEKPEEVAPTGTTIGASATVEELEEAKVSEPASKTRSAS